METSSTPNKNGSYGSDLGDKVTFEFDVRLPANGDTQQTATRLRSFLRQMPGIDRFIVEPEKQSVLIVTKKQSRDIQQAIEEVTGVPAVLKGMGAGDETGKEHLGAAVAIVTQNGDELDKTSVVGVARFLQTLSTGGSVIDATIDGLPPRKRINLGIGEYGDISRGCASCGPLAVDAIGHDSAILGGAETDDNGRLSFRTTKNELKVGDIIGRSLILFDADGPTKNSSRSSPPPSSPVLLQRFGCGIVARSAGLFENTKRVCSCSGKSLWEERQEAKAAAATTSTTPAVAAAAMGNKF